MEKQKERILFTNYYSDERFDETQQWLKERKYEDENIENYEPSDEEIYEALSFQEEIEWDAFARDIKTFINTKSEAWILQGDVGTWRGAKRGGFVFKTFDEMLKATRDCNSIEFKDVDGHLYLTCSHHDGTNYFEIKKLTYNGYNLYVENDCDDSEEFHNTLLNTNFYSGLPYYAKTVWGV